MTTLAPAWAKAIVTALDQLPCGRCGDKKHALKQCPVDNPKPLGGVWERFPKNQRQLANEHLKTLPAYSPLATSTAAPDPPAQKKKAEGGGKGNFTQSGLGKKRPQKQGGDGVPTSSKPATKYVREPNYYNRIAGTDMYYPKEEALSQKTPTNTGRAWSPPKELLDRTETLKIESPEFALRQEFFSNPATKRILTNHFEYSIDDGTTFYEYKILDLDTKNRKKLRVLIKNAIEEWDFLRGNQASFATNHIDTIVSWEPLHYKFEEGEKLKDDGIAEWGRSITVGDMKQALRFRFVKKIPVFELAQYASANPSYENTNFDDIAKCLNLVISKSFNDEVHKLSANKFFVKKARVPLKAGFNVSDSLEIIRGYFYNVKPGMGNIILNFNISTSAVFRPVNVADFLNDNHTFDKDMVAKVLVGRNVYVDRPRFDSDPERSKHLNSEDSRYWRVFELQRNGNIEDLKFRKKKMDNNGKPIMQKDKTYEMEATDTLVVDHLANVFGKHPVVGRKAVNVGSRQHPIWYAQEHLRIVPYQPYTRPVPDHYTTSMVKEACRSPESSRAYIENEGLKSLGFTTSGGSFSFANIPLRLYPTMLQVPRVVLPFPAAVYRRKNNSTVEARKGSRWKWPYNPKVGQGLQYLEHKFYTTTPQIFKYVVIAAPGCHLTTLGWYTTAIIPYFVKCGISEKQARPISAEQIDPFLSSTSEADIQSKLNQAAVLGAKVVILVLPTYNITTYRNFKSVADRGVGIQSFCLVQSFTEIQDELMTNVMMKLNLKLGGVNHIVDAVKTTLQTNTMVLGADLIHPSPSDFPGTPSIASMVGSVDDHVGKCLGSMRLQGIDKTDREIMDYSSVVAMVTERLSAWTAVHNSSTNRLPTNIIYYRDGVSSGHYPKVQQTELKAIREAYNAYRTSLGLKSPQLNLTAVIVTKRHHTRFYPKEQEDKDNYGNQNCLPGTCVDKLVTSPYYQDFYLQSHSGIKGTARPTHYFVLQNEIPGLTLESLRDLTHNLCYSYVRSMTPVSYVSPTYYADRLCERGRLYIRKYFNGDDDNFWDDLNTFKTKLETESRIAREKQFGTAQHRREKAEKNMEKEHAERIAKDTKMFVFKRVAKELYRDWDEMNSEASPGNP